jgi:hypothetical protein
MTARRLVPIAALVVGLAAWASTTELVEVSAPVFPAVLILYTSEGPNFPSTPNAEADLAHRAALTFPALMTECAAKYPAITLAADGGTLTSAALVTNYETVARCAYEQHTAKPYWIPRLVDDVDICGTELGAGWRLPTEADLATFTEAELQGLQDALNPARNGAQLGALYFSMQVYVRGADGGLMQGDLNPGLTGPRVTPLPALDPTVHLESGLALRCVRRTSNP